MEGSEAPSGSSRVVCGLPCPDSPARTPLPVRTTAGGFWPRLLRLATPPQ
jgi:hypothetical protein